MVHERGNDTTATPYNATDSRTTIVKPKDIASIVASTGLITEAQPLIPQAQGTISGSRDETCAKPKGNGIPKKNAIGAIKPRAESSLIRAGADINCINNQGSKAE